MRIAKPILLVTTPVGVVWGRVEAYRMGGLTWRISLSLALFLFLMLGARLHLIVPHGGP